MALLDTDPAMCCTNDSIREKMRDVSWVPKARPEQGFLLREELMVGKEALGS